MMKTAKGYIQDLNLIKESVGTEIPKIRIFNLSKEYINLPVSEVIVLLRTDDHELRVAAVAILDWKARNKKTSILERKEIYEAYINNHKWIDDWGLVDRSAPYVVGGYLYDKDRSPLYRLAKSDNPMERRTAIVSTYYFIRKKDLDDTFKIGKILVQDKDEYVQKAVGGWIREAGKHNLSKLIEFLDENATIMPRIMLRYAIEKLNNSTKQHYLNANKTGVFGSDI